MIGFRTNCMMIIKYIVKTFILIMPINVRNAISKHLHATEVAQPMFNILICFSTKNQFDISQFEIIHATNVKYSCILLKRNLIPCWKYRYSAVIIGKYRKLHYDEKWMFESHFQFDIPGSQFGPHVGPMNLAIWDALAMFVIVCWIILLRQWHILVWNIPT